MKIITKPHALRPLTLAGCSKGDVVRLNIRLGSDASAADPYLIPDMQAYSIHVNDVCRKLGRENVVIINLRTGRLSYVTMHRKVTRCKAEVVVTA